MKIYRPYYVQSGYGKNDSDNDMVETQKVDEKTTSSRTSNINYGVQYCLQFADKNAMLPLRLKTSIVNVL